MLRTWFFTVFSEIVSSPAISRLLMPVAIRRSTCNSRSVSRGGAVVRVSACLASELNSVRSFDAIDGVTRLLNEFTALANRVDGGRVAPSGPRLTGREVEVLGYIARGRSNREIAEELFISENTVKNHVRNILEKLQLHSRTEAALYAVREQIIDLG